MAPRVGDRAEDDGYVLAFVSDSLRDTSECPIFGP
jgi:carotenoid cleavage dioxygenase-like enzyme